MRLDNEKPSDNVEDRRSEGGMGGGMGFPGGGRRGGFNIPMGGRGGGFSISTIVLMVLAYLALKFPARTQRSPCRRVTPMWPTQRFQVARPLRAPM
jgi:predicted metalloprotease